MKKVKVFPNAKINIGLYITGKRPDGYHTLETCFYPVFSLTDSLEIEEIASEKSTDIEIYGIDPGGNPNDNLCIKAWNLLKSICPELPHVHIKLTKNIPSGAGLGGGSSDAAFTLDALNTLFELNCSPDKLAEIGVRLGADVPFFLINEPCIAKGIGERLEKVKFQNRFSVKVKTPAIHSNTTEAYRNLVMEDFISTPNLEEKLLKDQIYWKNDIVNAFERQMFLRFPELKKVKTEFYEAGAFYASMSGSGSAFYGLFPEE